MRFLLALLLWTTAAPGAVSVADLSRSIRETALDPEECYRVRELTMAKEDLRLYFTDGYLIFAKPVSGHRVAAIFTADTEGGDGEVLVLPPNRGERRSLAAYTGSPNMDEHIDAAVMVFTDNTYEDLIAQIRANPFNRKSPEVGALAADKWSETMRNIVESFETRLAMDLLADPPEGRFFAATVGGRTLGNFDVWYEPRAPEQIMLGQVATRQNRAYFDTWTSFQARSFRDRTRQPEAEFSLSDFRIDATLEPDLNLKAVVKVKAKADSRPQPVLPFDVVAEMRISAVTVDGRPAELLQRESLRANLMRNSGNEMVLVVPPEPLLPGRVYEIEFREEGRVVHDAGNQVYVVSARNNWYPNRFLQFATYDIVFRYPKGFDLVAAGQVTEDRTEGEWRITRHVAASPIRVAGFNLGHYDRSKQVLGGYTVEVCADRSLEQALEARARQAELLMPPSTRLPTRRSPPSVVLPPLPTSQPDPRARLEELASDVGSALEFMAARFGPPALESLTVSPVPGAFGQGFPGLIYLSTFSYLRPQDRAASALNPRQQVFFWDLLEAHETAHQWWGNIVATAGYHDDWLMEALANYSALLYLEKFKGPRPFEMVLQDYHDDLLARNASGEILEAAGPIVLGGRLESSQSPNSWRAIVYGKGCWIMQMLRRKMGDQQFLALLGELRRRWERKAISTDQFRALAAEFLPPKSDDPQLMAFFDQWVYGTGIPDLKLSYAVKGSGRALRLEGTVTQAEVDDEFSVAVPVEIQFGRGKPVVQIVRTSSGPVSFTVPLQETPTKVVLDPHWSVLRR